MLEAMKMAARTRPEQRARSSRRKEGRQVYMPTNVTTKPTRLHTKYSNDSPWLALPSLACAASARAASAWGRS